MEQTHKQSHKDIKPTSRIAGVIRNVLLTQCLGSCLVNWGGGRKGSGCWSRNRASHSTGDDVELVQFAHPYALGVRHNEGWLEREDKVHQTSKSVLASRCRYMQPAKGRLSPEAAA